MKFLRGLKRNNDRNWFNDRKTVYEHEIKAPMLALIGEIDGQLACGEGGLVEQRLRKVEREAEAGGGLNRPPGSAPRMACYAVGN